ncbi:hypothetical protein D3C78_1284330 [compost metagenome]
MADHHVQELGGGWQAELVHFQQQPTRHFDPAIDLEGAIQRRIGDQAFPAHHGARFFKIGAHHDFEAILITDAQRIQTAGIIDGGVKIVNRAGADHHQQATIFAGQNFFNSLP